MSRAGQPSFVAIIHTRRAGIQLDQGRTEGNREALEAAGRWLRDSGLLDDGLDPLGGTGEKFTVIHRRELPYLVAVRVLLAEGETGAALELLASLAGMAERSGRVRSSIEILVLEALARETRGEREEALAALRRALALAEPEGFVRIFVDEGPELAGLIERAAPGATSPDYARRLAEACGPARASGVSAPAPPPPSPPRVETVEALAEPLSDREIEVLRLIATGLSNADAGQRLFIAPSTVKKHLENIYAKLGTRNRTQAIARARGAGLL
jgi:LuxR family maltose regulon positive regulatory protein